MASETFDYDGISVTTNSDAIKSKFHTELKSISKSSVAKKKFNLDDQVFVTDDDENLSKKKNTKKDNIAGAAEKNASSTKSSTQKVGRRPKDPATKKTLLQKKDTEPKNAAKVDKFEPPEKHDHSFDSSDYAMEIRTAKPGSFKKVIEIISPLLTDAVLRFQPDGIYIFAMDAIKVAFVSVHLKEEYFEFYALNGKTYDIGVDTSNLNRILACVQKYETLTFVFHSPDTCKNLHLIMESTTRQEFFMATLFGIEPKVNNYEIPEQRYDSIMTLPAPTFQTHINNLSNLAAICTFKTDGKIFVMEVKGEFGTAREVIKPSEHSMKFISKGELRKDSEPIQKGMFEADDDDTNSETQDAPNGSQKEHSPDEFETIDIPEVKIKKRTLQRSYKDRHEVTFEGPVIQATHIMKYLKVFCKATPLSKFVYMFFQQDEPLVLSYDIRGLGTLIYCICDVSEKGNEIA